MSKKVLETLFNSRARVRLLRFLFRNYPQAFTAKELTRHLQEDGNVIKKEIAKLRQVNLLIKNHNEEKSQKKNKD